MNFDDILLSPKEKLILLHLRFCKKRKGNVFACPLYKLWEYGLIVENHTSQHGPEGEAIPDGTYSLTDKAKRYRIYIRRQRFQRYITPFTVSAITTTGLYILEHWLLPVLSAWVQGHFSTH